MAYEIPTTEPDEITAGNLVKWTIAEDNNFLIADGWVLSYAFVTNGKKFAITATDNGDNTHLASLTAVVSAKLKTGTYRWQSYVTLASERYDVDSGTVVIQPNFATLNGGYDGRTHAEKVLDAIQLTLEGRATKDQSSYTISGRQLSRTPVGDLIMLRDKYKSEVASEKRAERIANGLGNSGKILTRFTRS